MRKRNGMTENFKLFEKREQIRDTRKGKEGMVVSI